MWTPNKGTVASEVVNLSGRKLVSVTCRRQQILPLQLITEAGRVVEHTNHRVSCLKLLTRLCSAILGVSEHGLNDFAATARL